MSVQSDILLGRAARGRTVQSTAVPVSVGAIRRTGRISDANQRERQGRARDTSVERRMGRFLVVAAKGKSRAPWRLRPVEATSARGSTRFPAEERSPAVVVRWTGLLVPNGVALGLPLGWLERHVGPARPAAAKERRSQVVSHTASAPASVPSLGPRPRVRPWRPLPQAAPSGSDGGCGRLVRV